MGNRERSEGELPSQESGCRKAGLPPDAWQKGATLQAFTAEIFSDKTF